MIAGTLAAEISKAIAKWEIKWKMLNKMSRSIAFIFYLDKSGFNFLFIVIQMFKIRTQLVWKFHFFQLMIMN